MNAAGDQQVRYEVDGAILTLTLARPEAMNAFTTTMHEHLVAAFDRADQDDAVRAVILTGAGRAFCAGADISDGPRMFTDAGTGRPVDPEQHRDLGGQLVLRILGSLKPVIAAVNGPAVGIGASMLLAADFRLAASTAKVGFVFVRRGISPDGCSSWLLPRVVGVSTAADWLLSGRIFSAEEGLRGGLFRSISDADALLDEARALAIELTTATSPLAVAVTRRMLWDMLAAPDPEAAHQAESRALAWLGTGPDADEGVRSFLEKRAPRFATSPTLAHRALGRRSS